MRKAVPTPRTGNVAERLGPATGRAVGQVHSSALFQRDPVDDDLADRQAPSPALRAVDDPGYSALTPRFWHGMKLSVWLKMLARHRFSISPSRAPMAASITAVSCGNSLIGGLQHLIYGRRARQVELAHPPLFIIGHWRSGTTLLHELLVLDQRHTCPTTYQCFAPAHFLLTERLVSRWLKFLLPEKRPMDDMQAGWDRPQEDEFALCNLGLPSHYQTMAFPNSPPSHLEYLDLLDISAAELDRWKATFVSFLKLAAVKDPRRIVLKSPTHTARLAILAELFPGAQFIHIVRDPRELFPSTVRLWNSLNEMQGLQAPSGEGVNQYVFECFGRMYGAFFAQKNAIPADQLVEIRYEDLVADPLPQLQRAYETLNLGDFDAVRPKLEGYFDNRRDFRRNRNEIAPEMEALLRQRWAEYFETYGYDE